MAFHTINVVAGKQSEPFSIDGRYLYVLEAPAAFTLKVANNTPVELKRFEHVDLQPIQQQERIGRICEISGIDQEIILMSSDMKILKRTSTELGADAIVALESGSEVGIDPSQNLVQLPATQIAQLVQAIIQTTEPEERQHQPLPTLTFDASGEVTVAANPNRIKLLVNCPTTNTGNVIFAGSAGNGVWIKKNVAAIGIEGSNAVTFSGNDGDVLYLSEIVRV